MRKGLANAFISLRIHYTGINVTALVPKNIMFYINAFVLKGLCILRFRYVRKCVSCGRVIVKYCWEISMHTPLVVILFTIKIEFGQGILKAINSQICQCSLFIPYCIMIHVQIWYTVKIPLVTWFFFVYINTQLKAHVSIKKNESLVRYFTIYPWLEGIA